MGNATAADRRSRDGHSRARDQGAAGLRLLRGVISKRSTVNIDVPVNVEGNVRYVMLLGLDPEHFVPLLRRGLRTDDWVTALLDRKHVLIARSREHQQFSGVRYDAVANASMSGQAI